MGEVLSKAAGFLAVILLGYVLRRVGFFKREDFKLLSKICLKITLPASIVVSFAGRSVDAGMLLLAVIGFGAGVAIVLLAYGIGVKRPASERAFMMLNISGCNIGNFVLPFAQGFLGPVGVMAVSLFDTGNSIICLGGAYGAANMVAEGKHGFSLKPLLSAMKTSIPLFTYLLMTVLSLFSVALPQPAVDLAQKIANANPFLAMLMLGVGFELSGDGGSRRMLLQILSVRFSLGIAAALVCYFLLPFPVEVRQALVLVFCAPISSANPAFTAQMKGNYGLSSAINSISIIISIVLITTALLIML